MFDARLAGSRSPSWEVRLLSSDDEDLGALDGVVGGSVEIAPFERLGGSASLTIDDRGQGIDWLRNRAMIVYDPGIFGVDPWPMGVYLFTSPTLKNDGMKATFSVGMLSKMAIIDEDCLEHATTFPAETPIIPAVVDLIHASGEDRIAVTPSDAVLRSAVDFEAGESILTVINALLGAAGYWALSVNLAGQFVIEPYVDPASREPVWSFASGGRAIHRAAWSHDQDLASIPNKTIVTATGTGDEAGIVGVATNENPESDFSYQGRGGRWITRTYQGEFSSQEIANAAAQKYLLDAMAPISHYELEHAILPLNGHDAVDFQPSGISARATVQRISIGSLTFDAHAKTTLRQGGIL